MFRRGAAAVAAVGVLWTAPIAIAQERLPDLGMARLSDITVRNEDGRRLLRYTATIVNVGAGQFELVSNRSSTIDPFGPGRQRIYNATGGFREVSTPTSFVFGGDGHWHWHVRDLETADLTRTDNGSKVGTGAKRGFCFFDNRAYRTSLPGAPATAQYLIAGCGSSSSLALRMGLSVGWGDAYYWNLPDQYVDITGLGPGRYRLSVVADADNWFVESDNANNGTWVDLQIKRNRQVRVVAYGPAA